jgi:hypothetical protein
MVFLANLYGAKEACKMDQDAKVKEAQEVLDRVIIYLNLSIIGKITAYKHNIYRVQIFTKENKLIMLVQIPEEWVKESNPKENLVHDQLTLLLKNLERSK